MSVPISLFLGHRDLCKTSGSISLVALRSAPKASGVHTPATGAYVPASGLALFRPRFLGLPACRRFTRDTLRVPCKEKIMKRLAILGFITMLMTGGGVSHTRDVG